ncbi:MAG: hypothetical protein EBQ99_01895 [Planctomycetes bacterium]|nr:hypothetical protein [Planctomycetota bacterium]
MPALSPQLLLQSDFFSPTAPAEVLALSQLLLQSLLQSDFFSPTAPAEVLALSLQQPLLFSFTAPGLAFAGVAALVSLVLLLLQAARPRTRPAAAMIAKRFMVRISTWRISCGQFLEPAAAVADPASVPPDWAPVAHLPYSLRTHGDVPPEPGTHVP